MLARTLPLALMLALALPAKAELPAPILAPGVTLVDLGIFCRPGTTTRQDAPETSLGYVNALTELPAIAFRQQEVPARIGVHFGVIVALDRDIAGVRAETWMPGATEPEVWYTDETADIPRGRGFVFEFPNELLPGPWVMEAYDGDTLLYRVEWQVLPGDQLPGVSSDCEFVA